MKKSKTVMIFAGPSGGHLFPALAFAEAWRELYPESRLVLITSQRGANIVSAFPATVFNEFFYTVNFPYPKAGLFQKMKFIFQLIRGFLQAFRFLRQETPDLCVGFGSYVCYPGMRLAAMNKIPTLIHEQNVLPGRATRELARHVGHVAVSFPPTLAGESGFQRYVIGLPIREEICKAVREPIPREGKKKFQILVLGGSQGSEAINRICMDGFKHFSDEEKYSIAVNHITGLGNQAEVREAYQSAEVSATLSTFSPRIQDLYRDMDMAITRAGANTLFELALFKIPAIVIPYPYAGDHQAANAEYFASQGSIEIYPQDQLTGEKLLERVRYFMQSIDVLKDNYNKLEALVSVQAANKLAKIAQEIISGHGNR